MSFPPQRLRDLFSSDITRDIPPVVYFHEQSPAKLADEVSEYIITGGWPKDHPNHRRVPSGIHEGYVSLLNGLLTELDRKGGPDLPNVWISGFYGSGKSSFAKLLGLALDDARLPDGRHLAEAWLARDTSPLADDLRQAWQALRRRVSPLAVVFDVGAVARDNEHLHAAIVRQVQVRLGYSSKSAAVAFGELEVERDQRWQDLLRECQSLFGQPWGEIKDQPQVQARFSNLMARLYPETYRDGRDWQMRHAGVAVTVLSPEEAIAALRDMLAYRRPEATLFLVVDEVSQYVLASHDRVERLRAFASALGAGLKGRVWLLALGQQKLDEEADASFLVKTKDRFPPRLRVHLAPTNIRDVVHKRLLQKGPGAEAHLRRLFEQHRANLKLYAYGCEAITPEDFVETYPLLPGHVDLLLQITSALRTRSSRAQGDDQAIRGLLQLLGELFRDLRLAEAPVGTLVTLDQVYQVQHTALDSDVQTSMARICAQCSDDTSGLLVRVAQCVALLELIQDALPTDEGLVARLLLDRVDRENPLPAVSEALSTLRQRNLLSYSEKHGYKIQSSAGEEWERERRDKAAPREAISEQVQAQLRYLLGVPERPKLGGRAFPVASVYADGRRAEDLPLVQPSEEATVRLDLRYLSQAERAESGWIKRSAEEGALRERLIWVSGPTSPVEELGRELLRSKAMVNTYAARRESLNPARRLLLQQEENRIEDLQRRLREAVAACFCAGRLYFRGQMLDPSELGNSFANALLTAASKVLPELYPHFVATVITPSELMQLVASELAGPSPKFLEAELGLLELDGGRYVPTCNGVVPRRIQEFLEAERGASGAALLARFGGPPFGYVPTVVKACVAGLLRAGRLKVDPEGGSEITAVRDAGVQELFDKDRTFRRATFSPAGEDDIGFPARARICKFFERELAHVMDREDNAIADAVALHFPTKARELREVLTKLSRLPGPVEPPSALVGLQEVLEQCIARSRQTRPTVSLVKRRLDALQDGLQLLNLYRAELTEAALTAVRRAAEVRDHQLQQLEAVGLLGEGEAAATRLREHLALPAPWRGVAALDEDLRVLRQAYAQARRAQLAEQEQRIEEARAQVQARPDFATLNGEQAHFVLGPLAQARIETTETAVAPPLQAMRESFPAALARALEASNRNLDDLLSRDRLVSTLDLRLQNRELRAPADVDALLAEIREKLLASLATGARVRLL